MPWTEGTITNVWSTTKTVTNLAALMLIDRGLLDAFAPVARYCPEGGRRGVDVVLDLGSLRDKCAENLKTRIEALAAGDLTFPVRVSHRAGAS